jgi:predicted AlkP superfamily phosphohydrolase/phosphomutase
LIITIQLVRTRRLREEYALLWLLTSVIILVLSLVPGGAKALAGLLQVDYPPTLLLALGLVLALVILLSHSVILTALADDRRDLAQSVSILEWQLRQLEAKVAFEHDLTVGGTMPANGIPPAANHGLTNGLANGTTNGHPPPPPAAVPETTPPAPPVAEPQPGPATRSEGKRPKVLVIGLDGATFDLIEPWAAEGYLPNLQRLMQQGASGRLRSTIPPMTGPAWTTFCTGTNPGKHGLYDWIARKAGTYRFLPVTALDCKVPTIYNLLSKAGRRVCAVNVPMTYPPVPVNGVMVSGLPAPSTKVPITYPRSLYGELVRDLGEYLLYPDPGQAYSDAGVDAFLTRLYDTGKSRIRAFEYLRKREAWDFAMVVFSGTDTVSHAMWKFMDRSHPLHEPEKYEKYGHAIRDYYRFCDTYLGQVMANLDDDTTLIVMSDHGFGPFHKFIHVNNWLIQNDFMRVRPTFRSRLKRTMFGLGFSPMNIYDTMMRFGLGAFKREVVRGQGQGLLKTLFLSFEDIDWNHTQAYSLGNIGQIRLNVIGREPRGCVLPGEEYERVREQIIAKLRQLRDPRTGELVVERIYRREEIYQGDQFEHAADIVFLPRRLEYFGFGEYEFGSHKVIEAMRRGISGTHRMEGIFLAYGRRVAPGVRVEGADLTDLAPTILHLMGETVPTHMDGRVLHETIATDAAAATSGPSAGWEAEAEKDPSAEPAFTEEEEEVLAERLRNLGYVG